MTRPAQVGGFTAGEITVTRGTVYVVLAGLEERGLVSSRVEPQGAVRVGYTRRLRYTLTDDGVAAVVPS
mgnify:FL=1